MTTMMPARGEDRPSAQRRSMAPQRRAARALFLRPSLANLIDRGEQRAREIIDFLLRPMRQKAASSPFRQSFVPRRTRAHSPRRSIAIAADAASESQPGARNRDLSRRSKRGQ